MVNKLQNKQVRVATLAEKVLKLALFEELMSTSRQSHTYTTKNHREVIRIAYYKQNQVKSEHYCLNHDLSSPNLHTGWVLVEKSNPYVLYCEEEGWHSAKVIDSIIRVGD